EIAVGDRAGHLFDADQGPEPDPDEPPAEPGGDDQRATGDGELDGDEPVQRGHRVVQWEGQDQLPASGELRRPYPEARTPPGRGRGSEVHPGLTPPGRGGHAGDNGGQAWDELLPAPAVAGEGPEHRAVRVAHLDEGARRD